MDIGIIFKVVASSYHLTSFSCQTVFHARLRGPLSVLNPVNYLDDSQIQCLTAESQAAIAVGLSGKDRGYLPILPLSCLCYADRSHGSKEKT